LRARHCSRLKRDTENAERFFRGIQVEPSPSAVDISARVQRRTDLAFPGPKTAANMNIAGCCNSDTRHPIPRRLAEALSEGDRRKRGGRQK
jgi:hypothetical protein